MSLACGRSIKPTIFVSAICNRMGCLVAENGMSHIHAAEFTAAHERQYRKIQSSLLSSMGRFQKAPPVACIPDSSCHRPPFDGFVSELEQTKAPQPRKFISFAAIWFASKRSPVPYSHAIAKGIPGAAKSVLSHQWGSAGITEKRNPVMCKRFIVLLGIFLGSLAPAAAQTTAPQIIPAPEHLSPAITMLPAVSPPLLAASLPLHQDPGKFTVHFSGLSSAADERDPSLEHLPGMNVVRTLFYTQSSFSLVQFWSGRVQLDAFQDTLHFQNVQLVRSGYSGLRSAHFSGLSLTYHFGRDTHAGTPTQSWRSLSQIVGNFLK